MTTRHAEGWQRDVAAVAEALFSSERGPPPAARVDWLVDDVAHFLSSVGGRSRLLFFASLQAVTRAAPLSIFALGPFWRLSLERRVRALERLERGPLALALFAVKTLLCLHWYEHPDTRIEVGLVDKVTALSSRRPPARGPR